MSGAGSGRGTPAEVSEPTAASVQLCSFRVGDEDYVIDIMRIHEIVNPLPITPVRRGSELIEGVVDLRGQIIPILDLRRLLGVEQAASERATKHVIVTVGGRLLGLVVDAMGRVIVASREEIKEAPALMEREGGRLFPAVLTHAGRLHLLLNLKALLEGDLPSPEALARFRTAARAEERTG